MMKARQYDRRVFSRELKPHVYAIAESNHADKLAVDYFCNGDAKLKEAMQNGYTAHPSPAVSQSESNHIPLHADEDL